MVLRTKVKKELKKKGDENRRGSEFIEERCFFEMGICFLALVKERAAFTYKLPYGSSK